jgi:hypothetical protein
MKSNQWFLAYKMEDVIAFAKTINAEWPGLIIPQVQICRKLYSIGTVVSDLISSNKVANTLSYKSTRIWEKYYRKSKELFLYETNVGAVDYH